MKQLEKLREELRSIEDADERLWLFIWIDKYEILMRKREKVNDSYT